MKKKTNKKAFTIVELVIVIAVLAILAAVLIPTFANLVRKANVSNDTQLVRNLNTALISANKEHKTMQEALDTAEEYGFNVEKISAKASENEILWDSVNDCFVYKTESGIEYIPNSKKTEREIKDYEYWQIADELPETQKYSIYAGTDWNTATIENLCVGFDAGKSTCVTSVNYVRSAESTPQSVTIRTNSGTLVINAPNDIVLRYGHCDLLDIQAIKSTSLHEYGTSSMASIKVGRIIFEKENSTDVVFVEGNNAIVAIANNIDMPKIKRAADVSTYKLQTVETTETDVTKKTETVVTISGENVTTETKDESNNTVDTPANIRIEDVKESSKIEATKENIKNEFVPIRITSLPELEAFINVDNPSKNGILCSNIISVSTLVIERDLTIDFNGHTISCSNPSSEKTPLKAVYVKKGEVVLKDTSIGEKGGIIHNGRDKTNLIYICADKNETAKVTIQNGIQIKNYSSSATDYCIYLYASSSNSSLVIDDAYIYSDKGRGLYAAGKLVSCIINDCKIDAGSYAFEHKSSMNNVVINGGEFNTRSASYNSLSWVYAKINGGTFNKWKVSDISKLSNEVSKVVLEGTKMTIVDEAPSNYVASIKINEIDCYKLDNDISSLITSSNINVDIEVKKDATINYSKYGVQTVDSFPELELNVASGATLTGAITTQSAIIKHAGEGNFNVEITPYTDDFEISVDGNQTKSAYKEEKVVGIATRKSTGEEVRITQLVFTNNNLTRNYEKVKLIRNIDLTGTLDILNDFTLDLNGHTITGTKITPTDNDFSLIKVASRGVDLTIMDSSTEKTGAIVSTNSDLYCVHVGSPSMSSTVTINEGRFITSSCTTINVEKGTVEINGGYFEATGTDSEKFNINCIDANYKDGTASISVKGGTFKNFNPGNNNAEGENTSFVTEGYKVEESTDGDNTIYTVVIE